MVLKKAWAMAQRMAANLGAELVLLHVLPGTPLDVETQVEAGRLKAAAAAVAELMVDPATAPLTSRSSWWTQ